MPKETGEPQRAEELLEENEPQHDINISLEGWKGYKTEVFL